MEESEQTESGLDEEGKASDGLYALIDSLGPTKIALLGMLGALVISTIVGYDLPDAYWPILGGLITSTIQTEYEKSGNQ